MRSPFPGMDPYLEGPTHWSDFHATFIPELRKAINGVLPENYLARVDEHLSLVTPTFDPPEKQKKSYVPDVAVVRTATGVDRPSHTSSAVMSAPKPVTLRKAKIKDKHREVYLKIIRLPEERLVTVLELLSPTNKYGEGRGEYMQKREQLLQEGVNMVELDLIRAGPHIQFQEPYPAGHYFALVTRGSHPNLTDVYPWTVRDPMPTIPIPLLPPDGDVFVNPGIPFTATYEEAQYWKLIDYTKEIDPPFHGPDAEWAAELGKAGAKP